jgi:hypothetical protein
MFRDGGHEQLISNGGRFKPAFAERNKCKPVLLGLSLAGNLVKPLLSLHGTEWRERGYGLCVLSITKTRGNRFKSRSILRSSRPQEIFQPPQEGFFSVHGLQLLGNIFQLSVPCSAVNVQSP